MRKATAFRGGANKTAPPCETLAIIWYLATVPGEQLQRKCLTENLAPRESDFQHPAKGGSTPAFACQRAAIAPLPCLNLHPDSHDSILFEWDSFKNAIAAGKIDCKNNLLRKCGLLAHTSAAFLKNCCTEKLLVCLRLVLCNTPLQTKKHRRSDAFSRFILSIYSAFLIKRVQNSSVLPW